jgi:type III restriction enzyme
VIVEVTADYQVNDTIVKAKKEFSEQLAVASGMEYRLIRATDASARRYRLLM